MKRVALFLVIGVMATSCATELNETQSGALLGSGLGAGLGAIIGNQTGSPGAGTAIGAGTGLLAGALVGEGIKRQGEKIKQEVAQQQYYRQPPPSQYQGTTQELHTMYNPRTGQTFPSRYKYDPNTGEELLPLQ
ncbi:MAG: glycine zipper family protein [Candidatus Omnitrophica bacterium]|nr:glycine zipper family protein [Candidatus Omnitrophota bacterium]